MYFNDSLNIENYCMYGNSMDEGKLRICQV